MSDEILYQSLCFPQTHPGHTSIVAKLFGLSQPDIKNARILEIGCGGGSNLVPLAYTYRDAQFLGFDLSKGSIAEANAQKEFVGLKNIEFREQDILDFDLAQKFDYIICHGILSWVPETVAARTLKICSSCLTGDGLAAVSYNTLPGWGAVSALRGMLMQETASIADPLQKAKKAREFLDFLAENAATASGYRAMIAQERDLLKNLSDSYFFHDHLSGVNRQFFFSDFLAMIKAQGLAYVGDADLPSMFPETLPQAAAREIRAQESFEAQEQYADFIVNRRFRTSILCKDGRKISRALSAQVLSSCCFGSNMTVREEKPDPQKPVTFMARSSQFVSDKPYANALFLELIAAQPKPLFAEELVARTQKRLGLADAKPLRDILSSSGILSLVARGFITLHADSPKSAPISQKPEISPIARWQAAQPGCKMVTSLLHSMVPADEAANVVLQSLDGTRTAQEAADILAKTMKYPKKDALRIVEEMLPKLAINCLLVS